MVSGIRYLSIIDRARYSKQETFLQESTGKIFIHNNSIRCCRNVDSTFYSIFRNFWIQPVADGVPFTHRDHRIVLYYCRRNSKDDLLQECKILNLKPNIFTSELFKN